MLKQLDMTETAKVVFNELNGKPATTANRQQLGRLHKTHTFHANAVS